MLKRVLTVGLCTVFSCALLACSDESDGLVARFADVDDLEVLSVSDDVELRAARERIAELEEQVASLQAQIDVLASDVHPIVGDDGIELPLIQFGHVFTDDTRYGIWTTKSGYSFSATATLYTSGRCDIAVYCTAVADDAGTEAEDDEQGCGEVCILYAPVYKSSDGLLSVLVDGTSCVTHLDGLKAECYNSKKTTRGEDCPDGRSYECCALTFDDRMPDDVVGTKIATVTYKTDMEQLMGFMYDRSNPNFDFNIDVWQSDTCSATPLGFHTSHYNLVYPIFASMSELEEIVRNGSMGTPDPDYNGDGLVTIADVIWLCRFVAEDETLMLSPAK